MHLLVAQHLEALLEGPHRVGNGATFLDIAEDTPGGTAGQLLVGHGPIGVHRPGPRLFIQPRDFRVELRQRQLGLEDRVEEIVHTRLVSQQGSVLFGAVVIRCARQRSQDGELRHLDAQLAVHLNGLVEIGHVPFGEYDLGAPNLHPQAAQELDGSHVLLDRAALVNSFELGWIERLEAHQDHVQPGFSQLLEDRLVLLAFLRALRPHIV